MDMEILNVTYKCKEGMREKFLETIKAEGLDEASRAEAGNIKYDFYFADADPDDTVGKTQSLQNIFRVGGQFLQFFIGIFRFGELNKLARWKPVRRPKMLL